MSVDVNEAFDAERAGQIAAIEAYNAAIPERVAAAEQAAAALRQRTQERLDKGELVALGNGRYRVTTGWDAGEVWSERQVAGIPQPMLMPEHNLDTSTGRAALYTRVPEWHTLGTVNLEGLTDLDEVLEAGGIAYEVGLRQARFAAVDDDIASELSRPETLVIPDAYVTYRKDTGAPFKVVGKVYTPIQNRDGGRFLETLTRNSGLVYESAGATYGGAHAFVGMRLPEDIELDLGNGIQDTVRQYLYWLNNHDGSGRARVTVSPWRIRCGNTERFNLRDAKATWGTRHTTNALSDASVAEAQRTLALTSKYFTEFKAEEEALARNEMLIGEVGKLANLVFPKPEGENVSERSLITWQERQSKIRQMTIDQFSETGKTAYSAERVFTDYFDHVAPKRALGDAAKAAARATAIIEGDADGDKNKVHQLLMNRVR